MQREYCRLLKDSLQNDTLDPPKINSTAAYIGERYCNGCGKEWGSMDVMLDILAEQKQITRSEAMALLRSSGIYKNSYCCNNYLFPFQRNLTDKSITAIVTISTNLGKQFESLLRINTVQKVQGSETSHESIDILRNSKDFKRLFA